ncbi:PDZ domain-containing protein [Candidatus Dependentiae bacterium]|nr:PDZ domain-containing protein [Candidatus Dependentiae bacterium]
MNSTLEHAVVQLFVQTAMFDWAEPYKPPRQLNTFGTGFFIDSNGKLVTNFHVVSEAIAVQAQVPSLGKERFDLVVISVYPERDIALLELTPIAKERFLTFVEQIPYLPLGESDRVNRGDAILALGYPLGQETLKITQGVISGYQDVDGEVFLQVTAPLNPGNSGGPCINEAGEVVGINTAIIQEAQNIGYVVPISDIKAVIKTMHAVKIVHRPVLGCDFNYSSPTMLTYLGNPDEGGVYINRVYKQSSFEEAGICAGDVIYKINHHELDVFGDTNVSWSDDKIHFTGLLHRFDIGQEINILFYRRGQKFEKKIIFNMQQPLPIRLMYPEFEKIEYEIIGGIVVMPLTLNHIGAFEEQGDSLDKYCLRDNQYEGRLLICNIFQNSPTQQARVLEAGDILATVNDKPVRTMADFLSAVQADHQYLSIKTEDGRFSVLSLDEVLEAEARLSEQYRYQSTSLFKLLIER